MRSDVNERLAHIATPFGKTMQPVAELRAGDIGASREVERHADRRHALREGELRGVQRRELPEPSIAYAISAKTRNDEDRLSAALHKMLEEDSSLRFYRDPMTKEFLLAGNGQQHVEIVVSRLKRRYGVEVELQRAQDSLPRNRSRQRQRAGPAQKADRRARTVRRLLDQAGAAAARREIRNS